MGHNSDTDENLSTKNTKATEMQSLLTIFQLRKSFFNKNKDFSKDLSKFLNMYPLIALVHDMANWTTHIFVLINLLCLAGHSTLVESVHQKPDTVLQNFWSYQLNIFSFERSYYLVKRFWAIGTWKIISF